MSSAASGNGGVAARRAVGRWAWRLFRREWRQQILVMALLTVAVGAAIFTALAAYNIAPSRDAEFGSARNRIEMRVRSPEALLADLAAFHEDFGTIDVIGHQEVTVPGSVEPLELRSQDPHGPFSAPMLALREGSYPRGADEIAVTDGVVDTYNVHIGDSLNLSGTSRTVVGLVENPANLDEEFALTAPSADITPQSVSILVNVNAASVDRGGQLRSGDNYQLRHRGQTEKTTAAALVLVFATVVMLLICLVATAAFAVIAQRRQRQIGMLAAIGATARHLRLVVLANGIVVGLIAAATGTALAAAGWIALSPRMETVASHRIDRFNMPWWLLGAGVVLAVATAAAAAWWPARAAARIPITQALSARPPRPKPAHRSAVAAVALLALGFAGLATGIDTAKDKVNVPLLLGGTVAIVAGILFVSPLAIRVLGVVARRMPIATRLALRDLARNQARSGAALAAISLGLGIAAATVVIAAGAQHTASEGNLSARQVLIRLGGRDPVVPERTPDEISALDAKVGTFASRLDHASVIPLDAAVNPAAIESQQGQAFHPAVTLSRKTNEHTFRFAGALYVATPELLRHLGIDESSIEPDTDVLSSQTGSLSYVNAFAKGAGGPSDELIPNTQSIVTSGYSSAPTSLITTAGLRKGGWQPARAGWLVESATPLSGVQVSAARAMAVDAGLTVETRETQQSLATTRSVATASGMLLALCVLAMTVGLIRSEAGKDLRTLTATGATSITRRTLTAATAAALALLGSTLGIAGAYLAVLAGYRHNLSPLGNVPLLNLGITIAGLPVLAASAGWLLAGREPTSIARSALE